MALAVMMLWALLGPMACVSSAGVSVDYEVQARQIYQKLYHEPPNSVELQFWVRQLRAGTSPEELKHHMQRYPEHKKVVILAYRSTLERLPTLEEYESALEQLQSGYINATALQGQLKALPEYVLIAKRNYRVAYQRALRMLHRRLYQRAGSDAEIKRWDQQLRIQRDIPLDKIWMLHQVPRPIIQQARRTFRQSFQEEPNMLELVMYLLMQREEKMSEEEIIATMRRLREK